VISETKYISGTVGGTFVSKWDYYSNDLVKDMWYPGGNEGYGSSG
jgi:hypothetical protein